MNMLTPKNTESVRAVIRCRPLLPQEIQDQRTSIVKINHIRSEVSIANPKASTSKGPKTFFFDDVFNSETSQKDIYDQVASPIVGSVLHGSNGTIFTYGQAGAGKTYTMQGDVGIIPRAFEQIFNYIETTPDKRFVVRVSFFEVYNEQVHDLLSKDPKNLLRFREKPDSGSSIEGLLSLPVESVSDACQKLVRGNQNRDLRLIRIREKSSRSHLIFSITVECCEAGPDGKLRMKMGKLNLVDLAGSEAHNKIRTTSMISQEIININISKSFITLGNVLSGLISSKPLHVPYRDSKLTRILQDSLGGSAKSVLIANIGPADFNYEETLHTLRFANRVKSIKNKPIINEDPWETLLKEIQEEIEKFHTQLEKEKKEIIERERKMIEEQRDLPDADRQRLLGDLAMREEAWEPNAEQEKMRRKLKKLEKSILKGSQAVESDYKEQEGEEDFDEERASYLKQIDHLKSQLKLKDRIISHFLRQDVVAKIEAESRWDEQEEEWILPNLSLSQKSLMKPDPSLGLTRSMSGSVRKSPRSRFRSENIPYVEPKMPKISTERFDEKGLMSHINETPTIKAKEDELKDFRELNRLNFYEADREEEKVVDHREAFERTRKADYALKKVGSTQKRREESSGREEEELTTPLSDEDDDF